MTKEERRKYNKAYKEKHKEYYKIWYKEHYKSVRMPKIDAPKENDLEKWVDINDDYSVSNYGRVWSKCAK